MLINMPITNTNQTSAQERKEREALREAAKNEGLMGKLIREAAGGMSKKEYYKPLASPTKAVPPPKRKPSLASKPKPKPKRKPMTVEQTNKVLKGMGLKPLKKKNKGKNG